MEEKVYINDTDKLYCRIVLDILLAKGIKTVYLSPGSRNAPLLIGVSCRPFIRRIIPDERTAAFMALGEAMVTGKPVVLICTSGTALYNYAPAIAEAKYQGIPLIVITADRPAEWIDQDDSQTLLQPGALHNIIKSSFDIPVENMGNTSERWYVNRMANEGCNLAISHKKGPVHINIHLDNPLTETVEYSESSPRLINIVDNTTLPVHIFKELAEEMSGKKILLTVGFTSPSHSLNSSIGIFLKNPDVAIWCETLSNLHLPDNPYAIDTTLSILEREDMEDWRETLRPDIVISIGGALISRKLKEYIRNYPPREHWTLGDTDPSVDCFKVLTRHISVSPEKFFKGTARYLNRYNISSSEASYSVKWKRLIQIAQVSHREFLSKHREWSELNAYEYILRNLPSKYNLFLSNGTPVRYGQLFTDAIPHASFGNRGVSGIEGTSATAAGCAVAYNGPTLLITGDMSFSYDTGILGQEFIPGNFKIIIINNEGGGIFRFIPSTRNCEQRDEFFCAPPTLPVKGLAEAYGWNYIRISSEDGLKAEYGSFITSTERSIMEIVVDPEISSSLLLSYMTRPLKI